jgi:uncharacterized protein (DUF4213/DUF364 family)
MWELYDALIKGIPRDYRVDDVVAGSHWTMVRSGAGTGLAMTVPETTRPESLPLPEGAGSCRGMPLRDLAEAAKSWNFAEAGLGMAAINAYWNSPEHPSVARALERGDNSSAFNLWRNRVAGKKVAVIGHFFHLEETFRGVCELSILEKRPRPGDYPDSACEFLLAAQDFVFATGVTLINKTLPRLLELSRNTGMILTGPSVSMAPLLFDWGVRDLQGFVVTDPELCAKVVQNPRIEIPRRAKNESPIFCTGKRVSIPREGG